tara:strand:+ start:9656 stop:9880 length:225 start_codon:yes stop_codon:yes gene_type:complete
MTNEVEKLNISLKSVLSFSAILFLLIGEYIVLHQEIEEAKRLPIEKVSKVEVDYIKKDIETLQKQIELIKKEID